MHDLLAFTIVGIVTGAIYAVAASGLVVTYTTSGIFNFAQGAIGMFMAFVYWELRVNRGVPAPIALILSIFVIAPLLGALIERVLISVTPSSLRVVNSASMIGLSVSRPCNVISVTRPVPVSWTIAAEMRGNSSLCFCT